MMRKRRKFDKRTRIERQRRMMREQIRITHVLTGIGTGMSIKEIHHRTGLTEKNIRKIIMDNPEDLTFALLKKEKKNDKNKR